MSREAEFPEKRITTSIFKKLLKGKLYQVSKYRRGLSNRSY
jgi:hypothetical protein